jgi:formylglycine-generating enzyme required for sulfatase activity
LAEAFCIWDGGRLPTEAEWNFAAAGGTAQRAYPWGSAAPDCTYANFIDSDYCVSPPTGAVNRVGSESPKGNGIYGQADLAGNVREWTQDWYATPYPKPCTDCATLAQGQYRIHRGGAFAQLVEYLPTSERGFDPPTYGMYVSGGRCARAP